MRPFKKGHRRIKFNPLTQKADEDQEEQQEMSYYSRISSSAVGVREEVLACIANLTELPTEITALETLKQLTIRLTDQSISVVYNAVFAIRNIIMLSKQTLAVLHQMGLLPLLVHALKKASGQAKSTATKAIEAIYGLLLQIAESVSFAQLRQLQKTEQMVFCVSSAMEFLQKFGVSEVMLEFLAAVAEYTGLRAVVQEREVKSRVIERIMMEGGVRSQCLACYLMLFSCCQPSEAVLTEMVNLFNDKVNSTNLVEEYKANFPEGVNEEEIEEDEDIIEQQEKKGTEQIQVEQPKDSAQSTTHSEFADSIDSATIMTRWLLAIIQTQQADQADDEDQAAQQQVWQTVSSEFKEAVKSKITSLNGVLRNSQLSFDNCNELVQLSWRVIDLSLQYLNQGEVTQLAMNTLNRLLSQVEVQEVQASTVETCLMVLLEVWERNFKKVKEGSPLFNGLPVVAKTVLANPALSQKSKMTILELIGEKYNPEIHIVSKEQNFQVGQLLLAFMTKGDQSDVTLQCQYLDTLFDVYCNQDFDQIFRDFGFLSILEQALKIMKGIKSKSKFFKQVLTDLKRFIEYKRQQMHKQHLI